MDQETNAQWDEEVKRIHDNFNLLQIIVKNLFFVFLMF